MLFSTMPTITNTKGIAIINRGFMTLSFLKALDSLWILEEGGVRTGDTFAAKPEPKLMPPLRLWPGLLPLARHYDGRKDPVPTL
jgi:hypothetical protein